MFFQDHMDEVFTIISRYPTFLFCIGSQRYASPAQQLPAPNRTIPTSDFNVKQSPETVAQTARSLDDFSVYTHVYGLQNVRF